MTEQLSDPREDQAAMAIIASGNVPSTWYQSKNRRRAIRFIPLDQLVTGPRGGFVEVLSDRWWSVHPVKGAIIAGASPQCNSNRAISEKVTLDLYPGASVVFISRAFVPININDYL